MKKCPMCAEEIQEEAIKCKHCGSMLNEKNSAVNMNEKIGGQNKISETGGCGLFAASCIIPGLGQWMRGQIGLGFVFFSLAIVLGVVSYGIAGFIVSIIGACVAVGEIYKCPKCRSIIDREAVICEACRFEFNKVDEINVIATNVVHVAGNECCSTCINWLPNYGQSFCELTSKKVNFDFCCDKYRRRTL